MKLLALVLLLSSFSSLTLTEVVNSFKQSCPKFFIRNPNNKNDVITPTVFTGRQYKKICQRWKTKYRFATLYDTERRIPVYSAYTFSKKQGTRPKNPIWKIEPQLDDITMPNDTDVRDMMDSRKVTNVSEIMNQAVDSDYTRSGFNRGHVFPCLFAADQDQTDSTFTLTNVAPQTHSSNQKWAEEVEKSMRDVINENCIDQAYIVTGVVPENECLLKPLVPTHFWSVFCCTSKANRKELIGKAYIAEQSDFKVRQPSIDNLNRRLTKLYKRGVPFSVFPGLTVKDIKPDF